MTVSPSAVQLALSRVGTHAAFPGLAQLPDGELLAVWRDAASHQTTTPGALMARRLTPDMRPKGGPWVIADWTLDLRDPSITVSRDGKRIWLTCFSFGETPRARFATSYDGGQTFVDWQEVHPGAYWLATCAPVIEEGDGSLILPVYGRLVQAPYDNAFLYRRPNAEPGTSWVGPTVIATSGRHYQEPVVIRLRNSGYLLSAFRYGTSDQIGVSVSTDAGRTWSAPTPKFGGSGRPNLIELSTGPVICVYRTLVNPSNQAVYRVSYDRGGTWGPELTLAPQVGGQMTYAALVETFPGLAGVLLGREEEDLTVSRLCTLHLLDTA